jgi:hypothetical protein
MLVVQDTNSMLNYKYQSEKNVFALKELENWVGNPKISCKVKMFHTPGFFFICEYRYHSIFHFWCVLCFKNMDSSWILPEISK